MFYYHSRKVIGPDGIEREIRYYYPLVMQRLLANGWYCKQCVTLETTASASIPRVLCCVCVREAQRRFPCRCGKPRYVDPLGASISPECRACRFDGARA